MYATTQLTTVGQAFTPSQIGPGFSAERLSDSLLELITAFLHTADVNGLGRVNKTWENKIFKEIKKYPSIRENCSLIKFTHVRKKIFYEGWLFNNERLFNLVGIGWLLGLTILHDRIPRFYWNEIEYNATLALQKAIKKIVNEPFTQLTYHERNALGEFKKFPMHFLALQGYEQALEAQVECRGLAQFKNFNSLYDLTLIGHGDGGLLSDTEFASIACLAGTLKHLQIVTKITDAGLQVLSQFSVLRTLRLAVSSLTDNGLNALSGLIALEKLTIENCMITGVGLRALSRLTELRTLEFNYCENLTMANMAQLAHLTLKNVAFFACPFMEGIGGIERFTTIENLSLDFSLIRDDDLGPLTKLTQLKDLSLWRCEKITGQGFARLTTLNALERLDLSKTNIDEDHLETLLSHCPVKNLNIDNCSKISAAWKRRHNY